MLVRQLRFPNRVLVLVTLVHLTVSELFALLFPLSGAISMNSFLPTCSTTVLSGAGVVLFAARFIAPGDVLHGGREWPPIACEGGEVLSGASCLGIVCGGLCKTLSNSCGIGALSSFSFFFSIVFFLPTLTYLWSRYFFNQCLHESWLSGFHLLYCWPLFSGVVAHHFLRRR